MFDQRANRYLREEPVLIVKVLTGIEVFIEAHSLGAVKRKGLERLT